MTAFLPIENTSGITQCTLCYTVVHYHLRIQVVHYGIARIRTLVTMEYLVHHDTPFYTMLLPCNQLMSLNRF